MFPRSVRIAALILAVAAGVFAQNPPAAGTPALLLPAKLVAGERATLAAIGSDGRLLPDANVEFSGGLSVTTDATGRAAFTAPQTPGVITARVSTTGASATATVVRPAEHPPDELLVDSVPPLVALGDRFRISGYGFRGDADANRTRLGDEAAVVLAASPLELVLTPGPRAKPGATQLHLTVGERQLEPVNVTLVALELEAEKARLAPKEKGRLLVRAVGTWQRVELEARNLTPDIIRMKKGKVQRLVTKGGNDNSALLELEGRREGDFAVSVRLIPGVAGLPDTTAALRHLIHALRVAPDENFRQRIQRQIHRLELHPQDVSRVRNELERMLSEHSAGEFGRAIHDAWQALLKR